MRLSKSIIAALFFVPAFALAASLPVPLERVPERTDNQTARQNGARLFVRHCLSCHAATFMRYNKLQELGLSTEEIKHTFMFASHHTGDMMHTAMSAEDAKAWLGAAPPDLSIIARAKASSAGSGADWLYTYLRTFYQDEARSTGWNNLLSPNTAMPHVLWELQGIRKISQTGEDEATSTTLQPLTHGTLSAAEFDSAVADLVSFLSWMAEPVAQTRKRVGLWVLLFIGISMVIAWRLNASFWKDIR